MFRKKQNIAKKVAIGSAVAAAAGYVAGVLTAPKSGKETRADLKAAGAKGVKNAEKELKHLQKDFDKTMKDAKSKGGDLSKKAKAELDDLVVKAKDAKDKGLEVVKAARAGEANDAELNKAVKQAKNSLKNLRSYLKK